MKLVLALLAVTFGGSLLFAQEPLTVAAVAGNRPLWPREVTVNVAHQVPIVINGKASGSMQIPAGRSYPVKAVGETEVQVDSYGTPLNFPIADTDLLARAEATKAKQDAAASAPPPAATLPTPAPVAAKAAEPEAPEMTNKYAALLKDQLIVRDGKKTAPFDAAMLGNKKYLAIYYSASWCPPCRAFTPDLVSFYKKKKSSLDKFDIIFVSSDKSEEDMLGYMQEDDMNWPVVKYDIKDKSPAKKFRGRGIPCLVIVDAQGNVLSHSYDGENYIGPRKVLKDLEDLLKKDKES